MQTTDLDFEPVRQQLSRIVASSGFARNERLTRFLQFVVEQHILGRADQIKESVVGVEVFGRSPDYNPRRDPVVRMEASKLRARLAEYYATEGLQDEVIIELPKGGYTPVFRRPESVHKTVGAVPPQSRTRYWLIAALSIVAVALTAAAFGRFYRGTTPITIAVLPLENLGHDGVNDDFADGLTDELIRNLSAIEGLEVRSRTSSFSFKGQPQNAREAGKLLNVDYILEGSVLHAGQKLRVNAQLVRVRDDVTVWPGHFDKELTDIFAIQDEISYGIVNSLRVKLGRGRRRYETNIQAYDLYLRASMAHPARDRRFFEQAIAIDPSFAPAWAGLAAGYAKNSQGFNRSRSPEELSNMRAAAEKAVQLDPLLAEAQDALAISYARDGKWKEAEQGFRRALELNPNRAETHDDFCYWLLWVAGRNKEALEQEYLARKADPLSTYIQAGLGLVLISLGRYDEAAGVCEKISVLDSVGRMCFARARVAQGKFSEAIQISAPDNIEPKDTWLRGILGYAYARSGRRDEAEKLAAVSPAANSQALIYAGLGEKDRTLEALNSINVQAGAQWVGILLNSYPEFAFLHGDPRLAGFHKRIGLPE